MSIVYIYADESCLGNDRERATPGGAAGLVSMWTENCWRRKDYWISEARTTNNRMAIRSAIVPLEALGRPSRIIFTSDSQYLVKGMSEWVFGWMRRGWKRKTGVVENVELWQSLVQAAAPHRIDWRWVRGHAGHPQNEYADALATSAARELSRSDGLVPSRFEKWLEEERARNRYTHFDENAPPSEETFSPAPQPTG
jgi:ribonuclease HI